MSRITLLSLDLDDLACYHAIHGLAPPRERHAGLVLERCLARAVALFDEFGATATLFVIGRDLERDSNEGGRGVEVLRDAVACGHELGNHGYAHAYDMVTWSAAEQARDLARCDALVRALDPNVTGFRAPGYTHDARVLDTVRALGYRYDSSALPSWPYYLAKLGIMGASALVGRRSQATARRPRSFFGPRLPHRDAQGLWRVPMSVTRGVPLPLIGTSLLATPGWLSRRLIHAAIAVDFFHLELHGIDFADASRDALEPELVRLQPELKTPYALRRDRLRALLAARPPAMCIRAALPQLEAHAARR